MRQLGCVFILYTCMYSNTTYSRYMANLVLACSSQSEHRLSFSFMCNSNIIRFVHSHALSQPKGNNTGSRVVDWSGTPWKLSLLYNFFNHSFILTANVRNKNWNDQARRQLKLRSELMEWMKNLLNYFILQTHKSKPVCWHHWKKNVTAYTYESKSWLSDWLIKHVRDLSFFVLMDLFGAAWKRLSNRKQLKQWVSVNTIIELYLKLHFLISLFIFF